jgi:hypothetical protein
MALAASNAAGDIVCGRCRITIISRSLTSRGLSPPSRRKPHESSRLNIRYGHSTCRHGAPHSPARAQLSRIKKTARKPAMCGMKPARSAWRSSKLLTLGLTRRRLRSAPFLWLNTPVEMLGLVSREVAGTPDKFKTGAMIILRRNFARQKPRRMGHAIVG